MSESSAILGALAQAYGLSLSYHDIWGREHHASTATLTALLAAMGVGADSPAAIETSLAAHERRRWREVLPPVRVVFEDDPRWTVRLQLPAALATQALVLRIEPETAEAPSPATLEITITPAALAGAGEARIDGERLLAYELALEHRLPPGYHTLRLSHAQETPAMCRLIVAPRRCYQPQALTADDENADRNDRRAGRGGRVWGAAAQLYSLRSERNWGIGDFTDLATLVELWGLHGAEVIGVNPLHALFPHNPAHASPYSPSSRLFLNVLYLDVEAIAEFSDCEPARTLARSMPLQARVSALRSAELVDYVGVAAVKREVLELLYAHFRHHHVDAGSQRSAAFAAFRRRRGNELRRHALFEALQEHFCRADPDVWGWPVWPPQYRRPDAPAVAAFEHDHADRVAFYEYLQWQADAQLGAVGRRSFELGLGVGLYADLAVSIDRAGAEAWAHQDVYALAASVGAPPDDFNLKGQNWGLPPTNPHALQAAAYEPFIATLRANMQHAGALRIDHVMGLSRLFWIPHGAQAEHGTYVHYPFDDLLGVLALESHRNRCLVIGEDLGTVADEVRHKLAAAAVLSYRLLYFERRAGGDFKTPAEHERQALLAASTHDLPTLAGWWLGHDLDLRGALDLFPRPELREQQIIERAQDRARLLLALEREQLLPAGITVNPVSAPALTPALARAIHVYLARSPAQVTVVQLEDVIEVTEQTNLPGTTDQHPNWRRKLPLLLERWPADERFVELARLLAHERGRPAAAAHGAAATATIPRATYRLQLHRDFTFEQASALVPYLADLGASHVYCSPFLRARPGSRHGYDVVDHNALNPQIGTRDDLDRLVGALKAHGMGLLIDIVPNHMGVLGADNAWWLDVLECGPASPYAEFFDIDWASPDPALAGRVLLPILGDQYGIVLERGEIVLHFDAEGGSFSLRYYDHLLPLDPTTYPLLLEPALRALAPAALPADAADALAALLAAFAHLPARGRTDAAARAERNRDKRTLKSRLARLARDHAPLQQAIDSAVDRMRVDPAAGSGRTIDALDALIDAQAYRLAFWRVAADEINYRRFFDINELAALRMDNRDVFDATHRLVLDLAASGRADGLRVDHPDGLADPAGYFNRLQERYAQLIGRPGAALGGDEATPARPLYVVAEKITAAHEQVPTSWAVYGTTGYRFANLANGLFVDIEAKARTDRAWRAFARDEAVEWEELAYRCRRVVMASSLAGELTVLAGRLLRLARADRRTRDFTLNSLRQALAEVVANFPVYRTYIVERASAQDRRYIDWAVARARRRSRAADTSVFDFIRNVLLGKTLPGAAARLGAEYRSFTRRLQQFTAPVAAKGIEDTALYRHQRLVSLNEVGSDPETFGITVAAFHGASRDRSLRWPHTMLATSTHDSKRSEDVRTRIDVISEQPAAWRLAVRRWSRINRSKKRIVDGLPAPSRNDEYLLYQTLIGCFPHAAPDETGLAALRERLEHYLLKAAREAKRHTGWIHPNEPYEAALRGFVQALLGRLEGNLFLDDVRAALPPFAWYGALNGIALAALKFTSPGVPDLYQGHELIELSLVDPDNRRPVDYERRRGQLRELQALAQSPERDANLRALLLAAPDGRAKLWTTWRTLQARREHARVFMHGEYLPLSIVGERARNAIAYARRAGDALAIVVVGRLFASLGPGVGAPPVGAAWGDTRLEAGELAPAAGVALRDALSGQALRLDGAPLPLARLLAHFPAAVLVPATT
jgi:(1->4)-alpha-D-glucan 1-alpha-D-glucosylmutase